ncbi:MAG: DUF1295 domain-containing protein [Bacteroidetes Order II. Incertae sedis bacterium]|nr:DUF1295 domain-containing protein [Bacteroidetes Order II. bacterium]
MNTMRELWMNNVGMVWGLMTLVWVLSLIRRDSGIVDVFWGLGFLMLSLYTFWWESVGVPRQFVFMAMVLIWSLRLAMHIFFRGVGKPEDWRYAQWRSAQPLQWWWKSYLKVFMLQGAIMLVLFPVMMVVLVTPIPDDWTVWDTVGSVLWGWGVIFEWVADRQLRKWKKNPQNSGQVMDRGLWRYSRHPNYFGEAVLWWGYGCFAVGVGGWWTLYAPLMMTYLLVRVSGVAMLETGLITRKLAYQGYIQRTSAFIPWRPKKEANSEKMK